MIEWIDRARTHAKQSLLREPWPLPFDREIPGVRQNLDPKFYVPQSLGTVPPLTDFTWPMYVRPLPLTAGHPLWEQIAIPADRSVSNPGCHHRDGS